MLDAADGGACTDTDRRRQEREGKCVEEVQEEKRDCMAVGGDAGDYSFLCFILVCFILFYSGLYFILFYPALVCFILSLFYLVLLILSYFIFILFYLFISFFSFFFWGFGGGGREGVFWRKCKRRRGVRREGERGVFRPRLRIASACNRSSADRDGQKQAVAR